MYVCVGIVIVANGNGRGLSRLRKLFIVKFDETAE